MLNDPESTERIKAARWLCKQGSREGVEIILEDDEEVDVLNALRQPELWRKWNTRKLERDVEGKGLEVVRQLAGEFGMTVEAGAEARWRKGWCRVRATSTCLEGLYQVLVGGPEDFILDVPVLWIVPREEAVRFWRGWGKKP